MRAETWFAANDVAAAMRMTMPAAGVTFPSMVRKVIGCCLAMLAVPGLACEMPDEGNMPLRRAVTRVEMLPEVDAWVRAVHQSGVKPQYLVRLDAPVHQHGRCYWPVEVRGDGKLWRRFLVTPDGKSVLSHD